MVKKYIKIKSKKSFVNGGDDSNEDDFDDNNSEIENSDNELSIDYDEENNDNTDLENEEGDYEEVDDNKEIEDEEDNKIIENTDEDKNEEESIFIINNTTEDINNFNKIKKRLVNDNERITNNFISKYEFTRILSTRTTQIERGSIVLLKNSNELKKKYSPEQLSILEIQNKTCPFYIIREIPNGNLEKWDVNELIIKKEYLKL